jgi:hypothetical protein
VGLERRISPLVLCASILGAALLIPGAVVLGMSPGIPVPRYDYAPRALLARISPPPPGIFTPLTDDDDAMILTSQGTTALATSAVASPSPAAPGPLRPPERSHGEPVEDDPTNRILEPIQLLGIRPTDDQPRTIQTQMVSYTPGKVTYDGSPTDPQRRNLEAAVALYPSSVLGQLRIHFTGRREPNGYGAEWVKEARRIDVYTGYTQHIFAHEIAHHIIEGTRPEWGKEFLRLVTANAGDIPPLPYAKKAAANREYIELAAEVLSAYAEGFWTPKSAALKAHLDKVLDEQQSS